MKRSDQLESSLFLSPVTRTCMFITLKVHRLSLISPMSSVMRVSLCQFTSEPKRMEMSMLPASLNCSLVSEVVVSP